MNSFPSMLESINDLSKSQIDALLSLSFQIKNKTQINDFQFLDDLSKHLQANLKKRPIVATLFLENSTRTKLSFTMAAQKLGAHFIDFNADTSSLNKGESLEETFLTLYHQGVDLCILRTKNSHELVQFKNPLPLKLINGGDGVNEHPSQALLDLFTLKELSNNLEGKTLSLFGDLVHSRVGHSLIKLLPQFGIKIILCGPREFLPNHDELNSNIQLTTNRDEALKKSDFIYLLRIQKERHKNLKIASDEEYHHNYGVTLELLQKLKKTSPVFHPGPANIGVEIDRNLMKSSLYQGYKQVENSLPVRMAIIQSMLLNTVTSFGKTHGEIVQSNA